MEIETTLSNFFSLLLENMYVYFNIIKYIVNSFQLPNEKAKELGIQILKLYLRWNLKKEYLNLI